MEAAIASLVAVAGTLLGSVVTYLLQRRMLDRTDKRTLERQLREQQVSVLSEFARAMADYRGGQTDWWHRRTEDPDSAAYEEARLRSHRLRAVVNQELYRMKIIISDLRIVEAAETALTSTWSLHEPVARDEFEDRRRRSSAAINEFVMVANRYVQATYGGRALQSPRTIG